MNLGPGLKDHEIVMMFLSGPNALLYQSFMSSSCSTERSFRNTVHSVIPSLNSSWMRFLEQPLLESLNLPWVRDISVRWNCEEVGDVDAIGVVFLAEPETRSLRQPAYELCALTDIDLVGALDKFGSLHVNENFHQSLLMIKI